MIPLPFDYEVAESVDHAIELLGRARRRVQAHRRRALPDPADEAPPRRPHGPDRPRTPRRPELRARRGRPPRHRRPDPPPRRAATTPSCRSTAASSPTRRPRSATPRSSTAGPSAAPWPTATPPATCRASISRARRRRSSSRDRTASGPSRPRDFFQDYLMTDLDEQEVITEVRVPKLGPNTGWSYKKFSRRSQDWAIVGRRRRGGAEQRLHRLGPHRADQHGLDPHPGERRRRRRSPAPSPTTVAEAAERRRRGHGAGLRRRGLGRVPAPPGQGVDPAGRGGGPVSLNDAANGRRGALPPGVSHSSELSVQAARGRLPGGRGAVHRDLPRPQARPAALSGRRGRGRQDRGGQGALSRPGHAPHPPSVLRGHRREPGRLRVGLRQAAPAHPHRRGLGHDRRPGALRGRALHPAVPGQPAALAGAGAPRADAAGPAHRRDRPCRRRVRGFLAGDPLGLRHNHP